MADAMQAIPVDYESVKALIRRWADAGMSAAVIADSIRKHAQALGGAWVDFDENPAWGWANRTV